MKPLRSPGGGRRAPARASPRRARHRARAPRRRRRGRGCARRWPVLLVVGGLGHAGRRGRARDVRDRRDVVPVDPVPDPQEQAGQQHPEPDGGRHGGRGDEGFDHGRVLAAWPVSVADAPRYCNTWQLHDACVRRGMLRRMTPNGSYGRKPATDWSSVRDQPASTRPALDAATPDLDRRPVADRRARHRGRADRALPGGRSDDDPFDRLPDARRPRGAGPVRHSHGADGREEFHVQPVASHGHLHCVDAARPGRSRPTRPRRSSSPLALRRGFAVDLSHLSIAGRCACAGLSLGAEG